MSNLTKLPVKLTTSILDIITHLNRVVDGCINGVGTVTLTNGATSTVLYDGRISRVSRVKLQAETADAAAVALTSPGVWPDPTTVPATGGSITIHHPNPGANDATFGYTINT